MFRRNKNSQHIVDRSEDWLQVMLPGRSIKVIRDVSDGSIRLRLMLMSTVIVLVFSVLAFKLFSLQVFSGNSYAELAQGNRTRQIITYAPRGKIFDRNGKLLADNNLSFQLTLTPYLLSKNSDDLNEDIKTIANLIGVDQQEINNLIEEYGDSYTLPLLVAEYLDYQSALVLDSLMPKLQGFSLDEVPSRQYVFEAALAHIIGYSGRVSQFDLEQDTTDQLLPTDYIGKTGIELSYDSRLRGQNGWVKFEVDSLGRPIRVIDKQAPIAGEDIYLSIDFDLQLAMYNEMKNQMKQAKTTRASGIAINPQDGKVLAMVSLPDFDNNLFVEGISSSDFAKLNNDKDQPLFNKVISGGFTSGSIIKPLVASAALQEGVVTENTIIVDSGLISLPGGFIFRGWRPEGLGPMNVRSAIAWSSNIYFYTVGGGYGGIQGLGGERLWRYYRDFGLGEQSGINLPNETSGRVPDEEWKLANKGEAWYQGDSYNISIGQGDLLISPLHITMSEAAIANNGYLLTPKLLIDDSIDVRREVAVDKSYLQIVREGMRQVLTGGTTCDCLFKDVNAVVAGKSGTAETDTPGGRRPHAWFTAFAPYDKSYQRQPEILATVLIEEGSGGSTYAAPVIAKVFEKYFKDR